MLIIFKENRKRNYEGKNGPAKLRGAMLAYRCCARGLGGVESTNGVLSDGGRPWSVERDNLARKVELEVGCRVAESVGEVFYADGFAEHHARRVLHSALDLDHLHAVLDNVVLVGDGVQGRQVDERDGSGVVLSDLGFDRRRHRSDHRGTVDIEGSVSLIPEDLDGDGAVSNRVDSAGLNAAKVGSPYGEVELFVFAPLDEHRSIARVEDLASSGLLLQVGVNGGEEKGVRPLESVLGRSEVLEILKRRTVNEGVSVVDLLGGQEERKRREGGWV